MEKDQKLRDKLIKEERKAKKYLFKNDFDPHKGFLEFLHELNESMFFKLSRTYENENINKIKEFCRGIEYDSRGFTWKDTQHLKRIYFNTLLFPCLRNAKVQYFKNISSRDDMIAEFTRRGYFTDSDSDEIGDDSDSDSDSDEICE